MFSSCLESIEPEGLNDLRGAKADLLRAQTALVEAQAAQANAQAAIAQAEAKIKEAIAKQEEAKVAIIEAEALLAQYQAEYQALVNAAYEAEKAFELEQAIAAAEAAKAAAELEAQKAAAQLELDLLEIQTEVAIAQAAYDQALKDLAAAKVTLSPKQKDYIEPYALYFAICEAEVEGLVAMLEEAAEALEEAIAVVDENKADKRAIYYAEKAVAVAEAALEGAKEAAAYAEAALEMDPILSDWDEELKALAEELETMARTAIEGVVDDYKDADHLAGTLEDLTEKYEKYEEATGYYFNEATGKFSVSAYGGPTTIVYVPETYVAAPVDEEGNALFGGDFYIGYEDRYFRYGDTEYVDNIFNSRIEDLEAETPEVYEAQIEGYEAQIEAYNSDIFFQAELERYNDAVAAYNDKKVVEYMQKYDEDYDPQAAVDEFNAAVKAFETTLAQYKAEYEKYYPESDGDAYAEIYTTYNKTVDDARLVYVKARQAAFDVKNAADVVYQKAELAFQRAERAYWAVINAAYDATGLYGADAIKAAIEQYQADKKAAADANDDTFDANGALAKANAINEAQLDLVEKAQAAYDDGKETTTTDAVSAWEAAQKTWNDAENAYYNAIADAENAYNKALTDAEQVRDDAIADLNVGASGLDWEYRNYLVDKVNNAANDLSDAINNVRDNVIRDGNGDNYVIYDEPIGYWSFWTPNFMTEVSLEETVFATLKVEDIVDPEYFYGNELRNIASSLLTVRMYAYARGNDVDGNSQYYYDYPEYQITSYEGFPLELPDAEAIEVAMGQFRNWAMNDAGWVFKQLYGVDPDYTGSWVITSSTLVMIPQIETYIENCETAIANLDLLPDFIDAIKAAYADFQKFVAEYEAEIDALRAEVEENWVEVKDAIAEMEMAYEAVEARYEEIIDLADFISTLMEMATGEDNLEAYVAALEQAYADAVEAVTLAEFDLEDAQADLESVMAGGEDAITEVEMAQKAYDKVAAELAEALAELEAAAEALDAAMVAVGAAEPEETPAE